MAGVVEEIYVTGRGSEPMKRVEEVRAASVVWRETVTGREPDIGPSTAMYAR